MTVLLSFLPVLLFLGGLFLIDSFKLIRVWWLLLCLGWGMVAAVISLVVNNAVIEISGAGFEVSTRYVAPVTEELFKFVVIILMVQFRKIGFMIDAAIYGFAVGAGFALAENAWYWQTVSHFHVVIAIVRGLGTALMHGGTVSIAAVIVAAWVQRDFPILKAAAVAFLAAVVIHSGFNHFLLNPLIQSLLIIVLLPLVFYLVFLRSTQRMQQWLEVAFSSEITMLGMIRQGSFSNSRPGKYLMLLKEHFQPSVLIDMYCFLGLYLELSIKAKRNLLLKENGFAAIIEPDIQEKLAEFRQLRKNIGRAGEMALHPLVRMRQRDLWQFNQLEE